MCVAVEEPIAWSVAAIPTIGMAMSNIDTIANLFMIEFLKILNTLHRHSVRADGYSKLYDPMKVEPDMD